MPGQGDAKYAHIVVEAKTGRVLHSLNARTKNYPASLTKIMTLYMTFEALKDGSLLIHQKLPSVQFISLLDHLDLGQFLRTHVDLSGGASQVMLNLNILFPLNSFLKFFSIVYKF